MRLLVGTVSAATAVVAPIPMPASAIGTASIAPSRRLPIDGLVVIGFLFPRGDTACRATDLDVEW